MLAMSAGHLEFPGVAAAIGFAGEGDEALDFQSFFPECRRS